MKATCTQRASERVRERLGLTAPELIEMLDEGNVVDIGKEEGSDRMHRLFFDTVSGHHFVAIQDTENGEVITVIPPDHHNRCSWIVDEDAMLMAEELASPKQVVRQQVSRPAHVNAPPRFHVRISTPINGKIVRYSLQGVDPAPYAGDVKALLADPSFVRDVAIQLVEHKWQAGLAALLVVKLGAKGTATTVSLWDLCGAAHKDAAYAVAVP